MNLSLDGAVVAITGGASGIGRATAQMFLDEGARVAILDRNETISQTAEELQSVTERTAVGFRCDITNERQIHDVAAQVRAQFRRVDAVIHCAAIGSGKFGFPFTNLQPSDWKQCLEVNILGMVHVAHAFTPLMVEQKHGCFVFLASVAGQIGSQTDPPYSAAKAANINFAQCLAKDLAPHNVRVNTVCPGMVRTPLNESVWRAWNEQQSPDNRKTYAEWADFKVRTVVPLGRWQTPEDIASMIVFLSSERAANITGQTINVDGGFVMHW
jgi:2-hydroxycyclohexanecarboxyl-CoA dehydrogenase